MTAAEALADVKGFAKAGRYVVTAHALQRMFQRNVKDADLRNALVNASKCRADGEGWKVEGVDMDGDHLTVKVVFEDGLVVVTVF